MRRTDGAPTLILSDRIESSIHTVGASPPRPHTPLAAITLRSLTPHSQLHTPNPTARHPGPGGCSEIPQRVDEDRYGAWNFRSQLLGGNV
jgi:hypothetical protein